MRNIYTNLYTKKTIKSSSANYRIKIMAKIINNLDLTNKKILDIGCYDGSFLKRIKNKNALYGIDANKECCSVSRQKGIQTTQFYFDDVHKIPFNNNFFDVISAGEIIEHIFDTDFFLKEIYRLLKKDGFLILTTPNIASLGRRLLLLFGENPLIEISPNQKDSSGHIRYFTFQNLGKLLTAHGFEIVRTQSDVINFSNSGSIQSIFLAKIFPNLGQSIIILSKKR